MLPIPNVSTNLIKDYPPLNVLLELLILLFLARLFSESAERLEQPATVGELTVGILLAAAATFWGTSFPFLVQLTTSKTLEDIANLGIFFLVLLAGIESKLQELRQNSRSAIFVALGGALIPLISGFILGWLFLPESEVKSIQAFLIGITMSITSIPATIKALTEFGLLHSRMGQTIVGAAIVDDIVGLFLLAILTSMIQTGHIPNPMVFIVLLGKVGIFFGITIGLGIHVYPKVRQSLKALKMAAVEFSVLMIVALAYGLLAEALDMHWILGAFMAGLFFEPSRVGQETYQEIQLIVTGITQGVLGPLFFIWIGTHVEIATLTSIPLFMALLLLIAFTGKIVGCGFPAYWGGLDRRNAMSVGVGMSNRGAMELIILSIALEAGLFAYGNQDNVIVSHLFSALVLMGVITTLLSLVILRRVLPKSPT